VNIAITGATGLLGRALSDSFRSRGHTVTPIGRPRSGGANGITWDPDRGTIEATRLDGMDAVVHLAGESIASGRWNAAKKRRILESRVKGTTLLARTLAGLTRRPGVLVSASAVGYYGDRGAEMLDESATPGDDFLAEVCQQWESSTQAASDSGIRTARTRFGMGLSPDGGALAEILTPFRLGVGGVIGSGRQYMSWVSLDDVVGAIDHVIATPELSGPVNVTAPGAVTNREFTKTLGRVLSRPTILPLPGFAARLILGEMADLLLLSSARVVPARLQATGYRFRHSGLEEALRDLLNKPA
jgi:uncharacterized protein (TIGR01777 family)